MTSIKYPTETFEDLLAKDAEGTLVVPNFQRKFLWEREDQAKLAASVLSDLPIGTLVLLTGDGSTFVNRRLCSVGAETPTVGKVTYILDGQQRLSSLRTILADIFQPVTDWENIRSNTNPKLYNRWSLQVPDTGESGYDFGLHSRSPRHFCLRHSRHLADDPQSLSSLITCQWVKKKDEEEGLWFHPAFAASLFEAGEPEPTISYKIAKKAAAGRHIPLWEIFRGHANGSLHERAVNLIAEEHRKYLESILDADPHDPSIRDTIAQLDPELATEHYTAAQAKKLLTEVSAKWGSQVVSTLSQLAAFEIPTIALNESQLNKATLIFEHINRSGTPLSVFDLVCARAVPGFEDLESLRIRLGRWMTEGDLPIPPQEQKHFDGTSAVAREILRTHDDPSEAPIPSVRNRFLNLLAVAGHPEGGFGASIKEPSETLLKQQAQLALDAPRINEFAEPASDAILRGLSFLMARCGVPGAGALHYDLLLLPIAYTLSQNELFDAPVVWNKLEYWYWVSLLGGRYREHQYVACVNDMTRLLLWCRGDSGDFILTEEDRVLQESRYSDKKVFLQEYGEGSRPAAGVVSGLQQFLLSQGAIDMWPDGEYKHLRLTAHAIAARESLKVHGKEGQPERVLEPVLEQHHIVPLASASNLKASAKSVRGSDSLYNSPLNITLITQAANRHIRDFSPEKYLSEMSDATMDSHAVPFAGSEIQELIQQDDVSAEPAADGGIRKVLDKRFTTLRGKVTKRLADLKAGF